MEKNAKYCQAVKFFSASFIDSYNPNQNPSKLFHGYQKIGSKA